MAGRLRKLEPNESGSLESFAFVICYVDKEVSMESAEEEEQLVGCVFKVSLMDIQRED